MCLFNTYTLLYYFKSKLIAEDKHDVYILYYTIFSSDGLYTKHVYYQKSLKLLYQSWLNRQIPTGCIVLRQPVEGRVTIVEDKFTLDFKSGVSVIINELASKQVRLSTK